MRISCSRAQTYSSCGRQYMYRYVERLEPIVTPFALAFGRVLDETISEYLVQFALGHTFDLVDDFMSRFESMFASRAIKYPQHWESEDAYKTGLSLVESFPEKWARTNLIPVIDDNGLPMVQKQIIAPIPNSPHEIHMVLDLVVMNSMNGQVAVLDLKTAAQKLDPESHFGHNAFQLTTYQYGVEQTLGHLLEDGQIANVGYMELIRRKVPKQKGQGPTVEDPLFFPRRSKSLVVDMLNNYLRAIRDIERSRFLRPTNLAFNSPCQMCDYAQLCVFNDKQGLKERDPYIAKVA